MSPDRIKEVFEVLIETAKKISDEKSQMAMWVIIRKLNQERVFPGITHHQICPRCFNRDLEFDLASYKDTKDLWKCNECGISNYDEQWKWWENKENTKGETIG